MLRLGAEEGRRCHGGESSCMDKLWETYGLSHERRPRPAGGSSRASLRRRRNRRIGELKADDLRPGHYSTWDAIEEFHRVNERYTYLTGQRDDVLKSKKELEGIIAGHHRGDENHLRRGSSPSSTRLFRPDLRLSCSAAARPPWSSRTRRTSSTAALRSGSSPLARPLKVHLPSSPAARRPLWPSPCTSPF